MGRDAAKPRMVRAHVLRPLLRPFVFFFSHDVGNVVGQKSKEFGCLNRSCTLHAQFCVVSHIRNLWQHALYAKHVKPTSFVAPLLVNRYNFTCMRDAQPRSTPTR